MPTGHQTTHLHKQPIVHEQRAMLSPSSNMPSTTSFQRPPSPSSESSFPPTILSPQPTRPFKRKLFDQIADIVDDTERPSKRSCASSPALFTSSPLYDIELTGRSRSDSFLDNIMSSRPSREIRRPSRYSDSLPPPARMRPHMSNPPSPSGSVASLGTASVAISPAATSNCGSIAANRVHSPTYRGDLATNGILVDPIDYDSTVVSAAHDIFSKTRTSPRMSEQQLKQVKNTLKETREEGDENMVKDVLIGTNILPFVLPPELNRGSNILFDGTNIPHQPMAPPLPRPKPDQHYCFARNQFSREEKFKQYINLSKPSFAPSTAGFWPFFIVEFKSLAKLGSPWAAENQAAGGGALCVNVMEKLLSLTSGSTTPIQSMVFSCVVDGKHANLWVHYHDKLSGNYVSVEVKSYYLNEEQDIISFRNSLRNILDWGIETRLSAIHDKLASIEPPVSDAMHEEPGARP